MNTMRITLCLLLLLNGAVFGQNKLDSTGNVGIGTINPNANLTIAGDSGIELREKGSSADQYMSIKPMIDVSTLNPGGSTSAAQITNLNLQHLVLDIKANDAGDSFAIRTDTNLDGNVDKVSMVVKPSGNVGIGTINPLSLVHVKGGNSGGVTHKFSNLTIEDNDNAMVSILTPNTKNAYFGFSDQDDSFVGGMQYNHSNNSMFLRVNDHASDLIINSNGDVGIGTTNPNALLEVGVIHKINQKEEIRLGSYFRNKFIGLGFQYSIDDSGNTSKHLIEHHSGQEHKTLTFSNGNVGVGTTKTDGYKFSVNGNIRATEVKVYTGWADYVFKDDYQLPTLKEVAEHIAEKGHLINIPSQAEVAANGIQLGAMNAKLLEKIEELTLYTLEQEEKLKSQNKQLNKQSKDIANLKILIQEMSRVKK